MSIEFTEDELTVIHAILDVAGALVTEAERVAAEEHSIDALKVALNSHSAWEKIHQHIEERDNERN